MSSGIIGVDQGGPSPPICVIGPGRAGTSVTMRILNLLGVYIGPEEDLVEPGPGGPKGFWERRDMMKLDDRLLRLQGGSWRNPPPLAPGWEAAEELTPEREQARALLERTFAGHERWGWKNPRVSLTAAFWLRLAPDLRFVICMRNPLDVAASIAPPAGDKQEDRFYYSRRGPKGESAYRAWLLYTASALANTSGRPRLFVSYEDLFDRSGDTVERLAGFAGLGVPPPGSPTARRIEEFIDADLRHHRTPLEAVVSDERLPASVTSLHLLTELLRAVAPTPGEEPTARFEALQASADLYARRLLDAEASESQRRPAVKLTSLSG